MQIHEAMKRLIVGRTTIVTAQRPSTVRAFDRLLVLSEGRIIEEGSQETLVRTKGASAAGCSSGRR